MDKEPHNQMSESAILTEREIMKLSLLGGGLHPSACVRVLESQSKWALCCVCVCVRSRLPGESVKSGFGQGRGKKKGALMSTLMRGSSQEIKFNT